MQEGLGDVARALHSPKDSGVQPEDIVGQFFGLSGGPSVEPARASGRASADEMNELVISEDKGLGWGGRGELLAVFSVEVRPGRHSFRVLAISVSCASAIPPQDGFPGVDHELEHVFGVGDDGIGWGGVGYVRERWVVGVTVVGVGTGCSSFAGAEASSEGIVVAGFGANVIWIKGVMIAVNVGVVRGGGRTQVSSRRVVGRSGVERGFTSCGLAHPIGPDLDAFCLGTTGASRKFLLDVVDEVVQVLPLRGGSSGSPRIWVGKQSIGSEPVAEKAGGSPGAFYPMLEMQRNVAGVKVVVAVNEPQFTQLPLEFAKTVDVDGGGTVVGEGPRDHGPVLEGRSLPVDGG